jgi:CRISPR/Cas system-associated endonuclease Cas1
MASNLSHVSCFPRVRRLSHSRQMRRICEAECRIALIATGLDPEIGLLHRDAPSRSSLANDLQEVLRPMVDPFVLNWIQTELFRKPDFWEDKNGNCRLMSHLLPLATEPWIPDGYPAKNQ